VYKYLAYSFLIRKLIEKELQMGANLLFWNTKGIFISPDFFAFIFFSLNRDNA